MMPVKNLRIGYREFSTISSGTNGSKKANSASPGINIIESDTDYKVELAAPE